MPLCNVDCYATANLVPCIVIGFDEIAAHSHHDVIDLSGQAGGLLCNHFAVCGVVLRLAAATEFARTDPWPLVRGFQDISDDVTHTVGVSESLGFVSDTSGEAFSPEILAQLDDVLAKYFRLPPLVEGQEAFMRFDVVDVLRYFEDWRVWTLHARAEADGAQLDAPTWVNEKSDFERYGIVSHDDERFGRAHVERLQAIADDLLLDKPVRAFLVWGNSD